MPLAFEKLKVVPAVGRDEREQRGADGDEEMRPQAGLALPDLALDADRTAENPGQDDAQQHLCEVELRHARPPPRPAGRVPISSIPAAARSSSSSSWSRSSGARSAVACTSIRRPSPAMTTLTSTWADESSAIVEVEHRLALDDSDRDGADRVGQRLPEAHVVERPPRSDVGARDRRAAGASVRLDDVAVDPERPLAERVEVGDGTQSAADQPLDLDRPALLLPRARLALGALARRGRQHRVLGRQPPAAAAGEPAGNALLDRRRAEHAGLAERDQRRAVRLLQVVRLDLERPQLVGASSAWSAHAAAASSSAIATCSTSPSGSWRKRSPSARKRSGSPVVRNR